MDYMRHTLVVEGVSREEADAIASALVDAGMAGREGAFETYAFDPDYATDPDGTIRFGSSGETKDYPPDALVGISARCPGALFVWDAFGYEEDCGRTYYKGGRSRCTMDASRTRGVGSSSPLGFVVGPVVELQTLS